MKCDPEKLSQAQSFGITFQIFAATLKIWPWRKPSLMQTFISELYRKGWGWQLRRIWFTLTVICLVSHPLDDLAKLIRLIVSKEATVYMRSVGLQSNLHNTMCSFSAWFDSQQFSLFQNSWLCSWEFGELKRLWGFEAIYILHLKFIKLFKVSQQFGLSQCNCEFGELKQLWGFEAICSI